MNETLVDRLSEIFWEAHRPAMLKAGDDLVSGLESSNKFDNDEQLREAVRIGIRAVLREMDSLRM